MLSPDTEAPDWCGVTITRERRLEMALELFASAANGAAVDLDTMKHFHPPSKRGSNYTRALESLERRLAALEVEAREVLAAKDIPNGS